MSESSGVTRRGVLSGSAGAGLVATVSQWFASSPAVAAGGAAPAPPSPEEGVPLRWLDGVPATTGGVSWGVPWARGQLPADASFTVQGAEAGPAPVQSWPLAYWPDGSLKWSGHAMAAETGLEETLTLRPGTPAAPSSPVVVRRQGGDVVLDNGTVAVRVATSGPVLLRSLERGGRTTASDGRLVLRVQDEPDDGAGGRTGPRTVPWVGMVDDVEVEQSGPVRGVVKVSGSYHVDRGQERDRGPTAFPWTVRVYLGAGSDSLRLVHHLVWDADPAEDFVAGIGLEMSVPLVDAPHDRHVRFSGEERGVWGEPVRVLTGLRRESGEAVSQAQVAGTATPPVAQWPEAVREGYEELPLWNDYRLRQESASHFSVAKRTSSRWRWLSEAGHGGRSSGLGYVGGVSGGLAFGLRDFWQQFPRALDVRDAAGETATVTLWSWSPYEAAMDMRPYDETGHGLGLAYEDVRTGFGDPRGISRSTEMELWALPATPARERFADMAAALATPPQLVTTPAVYHAAGVFGRWSLPDRSTSARAALEDSIEASVDFYARQVDDREWYGFWSYGDVMHTYDADRHWWRYDVGGFAWDNAELGTDAMLWYAFLRTGRPLTFRLASAMTRHVSESDSYVRGRYAGLGSRHNVLHWGDGAKELRVNEAFTKRFKYYVTADELTGDLIRATLQADETLLRREPFAGILPLPAGVRSRVRIGPDWYALVSNWLAEWERTGDTRWRDRIVTGMRDIATFPAGLFTGEAGGAVGFDPATAHLTKLDTDDFSDSYNLAMSFLGDEIMFTAVELVDVPEFRQVLLDFARYVQAPSEEKIARYGRDFDPGTFPTIYSRVTAWAGEQLDEPEIRRRGWQRFLDDPEGQPWPAPVSVDGTAVVTPVTEIPAGDFATNSLSQRNLAIIELLAVAPEEAP